VFYRLIAQENELITYLLNIVLIIAGLYLDKTARKFADKSARIIREELFAKQKTFFYKAARAMYIFSQVFFRTTMYQFYMVATILSVIIRLRPGFLPVELGNFFSSIEYGILLLLVFDNIKALTEKDGKWFRKHIGLESNNDNNEEEQLHKHHHTEDM
jgi:hypothetical protein